MTLKIPGQSLIGFGDYFEGDSHFDTVGANPLRRAVASVRPQASGQPPPAKVSSVAKKAAGSMPRGNVPVRKTSSHGKVSPHKAALANAAKAGNKAKAAGKKANTSAQKAGKVVAAGERAVIGAVTKRKLTPKQQVAVARHAKTLAALRTAQKQAAAAAALATTKGQAALDFVKKATPEVRKALLVPPIGGGSTAVGFDDLSDEDVVGLALELVGLDGNGLAPGQPGYDPTTDADASTDVSQDGGGTGPASVDPGTGQVLDPQGNVLYDPATDPDVIPAPQRGQALTSDELQEIWENVPDDAFVYNVSEGGTHYPQNSVGSFNTFFGPNKNAHGWAPGFIFGGEDWLGPSPDDPDTFWHGKWGSTPELMKRSLELGWGPITGNPGGQLANTQYARADKKWFWQGKAAPLAYSAEADAKIAQANQATMAANRAAAVALAKQMQADQVAAAEAQAKQDAANALAESAAASQASVAQTQQQTQQAQLELQTQQAQLQQAQAQSQVDTQAQQLEVQQAQQSGDLAYQQAQRAGVYLSQHPEEEFDQQGGDEDGEGGGYDEDGGGDVVESDVMDDGSPPPGGDLMDDADGEGYDDEG